MFTLYFIKKILIIPLVWYFLGVYFFLYLLIFLYPYILAIAFFFSHRSGIYLKLRST